MLPINKYKADISILCAKHKVRHLYVFGSALNDHFNSTSDVDLIVDFKEIDLYNYADNYYELKSSLEKLFNHSVDLLEEQAIRNPYFLRQVKHQRQLVYG